MSGITWLHISDWHQKGTDFDPDPVRKAFLEDIQNRAQIHRDLKNLDFIVCSGDMTFDGKKESFEAVTQYLMEPLLASTELGAERVFMVPGNHDLDRQIATLFREQILLSLTSDEIINSCLGKQAERKFLLKPFKAFETFAISYAEGRLSAFASFVTLKIKGFTIALLGFNTALLCGRGDNDFGNLYIGEYPVTQFLARAREGIDLRLAVMHHPFAYLTQTDQQTVVPQLKEGVHFVLCGHPHSGSGTLRAEPDQSLIIPAGATYNRRANLDPNYTSTYNLVHLDMAKKQGTIYLRKWDEEQQLWTAYKKEPHPNGAFHFQLPTLL